MSLRGFLLLALFVPSIPICFFRPFYGIVLWVVFAFLNPQWYAWGAGNDLPWAMVVAVPTLAGFLVFDRGWNRLRSSPVVFVAALWVWFTITSFIAANSPAFVQHAAATWFRWQFVSKVLLMAVVMVAMIRDFRRLRILVLVIAGCFGFLVLKAVPFMIVTGGTFRLYGPPYSMIADNNDFGLALNMTLPIFFFLAKCETNRWVKRLFGLLFLATIPAIFFTYSRGAVVGLTAVLVVMALQVKQRVTLIPAIVFGITVVILFAPESWKARMDPNRPGALDASAQSRLNAWRFCWNLASDSLIAGGGFETFTPALFDVYAPNVRDVHGPHSIYFGVLAEHGFVGLFIYLGLVASCFRTARRIVNQARLDGDYVAVHYANMFRFSLVGFLTSGAFLGRAYFDYFFTIVACIAALERIYLDRRQAESALVPEEPAITVEAAL